MHNNQNHDKDCVLIFVVVYVFVPHMATKFNRAISHVSLRRLGFQLKEIRLSSGPCT